MTYAYGRGYKPSSTVFAQYGSQFRLSAMQSNFGPGTNLRNG
jgi:hypothetical protein